jgi:fluoroquinolone transport system ATP-binding protein
MLQVHDLSYTYPGAERPAVEGLGFEVAEGEIFGLLGPSGAGKSTTQGVLIGLLKGWQGEAQVMGRSLPEWGADYYEHVGVSFEVPNHFLKLTARENLDYFRSLYSSATSSAAEVLELVGLTDSLDVRVADFSKGMKNRLTFARSLLHRPKLLFLDEPTAGLDPGNARKIREIVRQRQAAGTTVVLTTHNMQVADELCDRVGFIVEGRLEVVAAPDALKRRYGRRAVRVVVDGSDGIEEHEFALDGLADNAEFLAALRQPVRTLHSEETTLEEVFIQVTGTSLR